MPIPLRLKTLLGWRQRSLANVFALRAAVIAIVSSLVVALISLGVIYWSEDARLQAQLQDKAQRLAERIEAAVDVMDSATYDLASSAMFVTALLDSQGRNAYVAPFLDNYRLPIAAGSGLALCDINGVRLAGSRSELSQCHADSPLFKQVIADGVARRELVTLQQGHLAWVLYRGVVFPYTQTVEGMVVTQLDLQGILDPAARDLDLHEVALIRGDTRATLLQVRSARQFDGALLKTSETPIYKSKPGAVPFPLLAVTKDHLSPFSTRLAPLVLGYGLGILLLVLAVVYWARRVSLETVKPLTELTHIATQISNTVDLSVDIPTLAVGEVGQLASALQTMVNTLRDSEASLEIKVNQRTEALQKSEAAADAANQAKSRFLATMSHEIRTPMNGILGMAQMLQRPELSPSERHDYAQIILSSGQTLMALLNDILDLSKIEAGRVQLEATAFAPDQLLHDAKALFSGAAGAKQIEITSTWQGAAGPGYQADAHRLRQMLTNLVGNAVKFTAQGSVHIQGKEISRQGDSALLEFSVSDTGVGIGADKLRLLFLPFSQADSSTTRQFGGTGLGLSIVHHLARLMGGDVGVESEPGRGSRFWFRVSATVLRPADGMAAQMPAGHCAVESASTDTTLSATPIPPAPAASTGTVQPINWPRFMALVDEITPLLAQNKFDAIARFRALQNLATGTDAAPEINRIAGILAELDFDLALARLHQMATTHVEQKLT